MLKTLISDFTTVIIQLSNNKYYIPNVDLLLMILIYILSILRVKYVVFFLQNNLIYLRQLLRR